MSKFDSLQDHEFRRDEWDARERKGSAEKPMKPELEVTDEQSVVPQSAPDTEWVQLASRVKTGPLDPIYPVVDTQSGKAVALCVNPKDAARIVSDHRAVPLLVKALRSRVSSTRCYCGDTDEGEFKCGECKHRELLAQLDTEGTRT